MVIIIWNITLEKRKILSYLQIQFINGSMKLFCNSKLHLKCIRENFCRVSKNEHLADLKQNIPWIESFKPNPVKNLKEKNISIK